MLSTRQLCKTRQRQKQVMAQKQDRAPCYSGLGAHQQLPKQNLFLLAAVAVEGFSWGNYINSNSFTAAPVTCFRHVSTSSAYSALCVCRRQGVPCCCFSSAWQSTPIQICFVAWDCEACQLCVTAFSCARVGLPRTPLQTLSYSRAQGARYKEDFFSTWEVPFLTFKG